MGVSFDTPAANLAFHDENEMQYELWSDINRELALYYQAANSRYQLWADRVTVVLDDQGRLCVVYPSVSAGTHPQDVLEDLTLLLAD